MIFLVNFPFLPDFYLTDLKRVISFFRLQTYQAFSESDHTSEKK